MNSKHKLMKNLGRLIEGAGTLFPEASDKNINQILAEREACLSPLTIITEGDKNYQHEAAAIIKNDVLILEKPLDWQIPEGQFHIFFRGMDNCWYLFQTSKLPGDSDSLSLSLPDTIYYLQRRRYKRVSAPSGTRAIFKFDNTIMDSVHVTDISVGGMLICSSSSSRKKYPLNSMLNEIFIAVPPKHGSEKFRSRRILPLIRQGKVVRSFVDQDSYLSCFGVSFFNESSTSKENLKELVVDIERNAL